MSEQSKHSLQPSDPGLQDPAKRSAHSRTTGQASGKPSGNKSPRDRTSSGGKQAEQAQKGYSDKKTNNDQKGNNGKKGNKGKKGKGTGSSSFGKKSSKFMDALLTLVLFAAIGLFAFAAFNLYHIYTEYKKGSDEYNAIAEMAVTERKPDPGAATDGTSFGSQVQSPMTIDFDALRAVNEDVIGWIYIEAFDGINYPVVRGVDNSYYLHRTYQRNYNFAGTIFTDAQNHDDFTDCNTIVYGHNMKNGSMFGMLRHFSNDPEAYNKSKYFWIFTPEEDYRYEIISAYITGVSSDTYTLFKGPGKEFVDWMHSQVSHSEIQTTPGELTVKDKIVTLSTCTGDDSTRYVVQGKRVNVIKK